MRRYQNFSNDHEAIVSNVDRVILTNRTFFGGPKDWCCEKTGDSCASYNALAKKSDPIMKDFHEKLCEKITQDGGDYRVVLFGNHAWSACANWFPVEKVINRGSIAHGSLIRNNWHREQARDDFLITVDRASAFLTGAKPIPFVDSDKADYLHIGNDPNREKSATTRKEKQLQRDPDKRAREEEERARKKEECTRKEEERSWMKEFPAREEEGLKRRKEERARKKAREEEECVRKEEECARKKAREEVESTRKKETTSTPHNNDVLCGRGCTVNAHPGNEHFWKLVDQEKRLYLMARFVRKKQLSLACSNRSRSEYLGT
jgi:hypothetical protein